MERKRAWLAPAVAGGLAGIANGFFGGGGGMVLVPFLTRRCGLDQRRAFATSVAVILPLCILSSVIYFFRGGLDLTAALPYLAGGLLGGVQFFGIHAFYGIIVILDRFAGVALRHRVADNRVRCHPNAGQDHQGRKADF